MDIKINIIGDVSILDLFAMRHKSMRTTMACHEYLSFRYKWMWRIAVTLVLGLQAAATFLAIFGSDNSTLLKIVTAATLIVTAIVKKLGLGESQKAYLRSWLTAQDIVSQMELIEAKKIIPKNFDSINEKIASFRLIEEPVPIWVKEKFMI